VKPPQPPPVRQRDNARRPVTALAYRLHLHHLAAHQFLRELCRLPGIRLPADRLLIETDAPDQLLPEKLGEHTLNDPANLGAVYRFMAKMLDEALETLEAHVEENFLCLSEGL